MKLCEYMRKFETWYMTYAQTPSGLTKLVVTGWLAHVKGTLIVSGACHGKSTSDKPWLPDTRDLNIIVQEIEESIARVLYS